MWPAILYFILGIYDDNMSIIEWQLFYQRFLMNLKYKHDLISEQEYLAGELACNKKHEFINGDIYAMTGASTNHNRIVANLMRELGGYLKGTPCEPFASDMKAKVGPNYFYPDVTVVCDHQANNEGVTDEPKIIIEVLSQSTRRLDHTLKRNAYQGLASLQEYVVIEQDVVDIEVCRLSNQWRSEHFYLGDEVFFESIDVRVPVVEIYDRVVNKDVQEYLLALKELVE